MDADEGLYHATPQTKGRIAHEAIDKKTPSNRKEVLLSMPVYSERFKLMGKIDVYDGREKKLIERKYQIKKIYQGQIYQLWAQMFCLREMGYEVDNLAFYETSTNKMIPVAMPTENDECKFAAFVDKFRNYNPEDFLTVNPNKCRHCIYCNLCDRTNLDNVYT